MCFGGLIYFFYRSVCWRVRLTIGGHVVTGQLGTGVVVGGFEQGGHGVGGHGVTTCIVWHGLQLVTHTDVIKSQQMIGDQSDNSDGGQESGWNSLTDSDSIWSNYSIVKNISKQRGKLVMKHWACTQDLDGWLMMLIWAGITLWSEQAPTLQVSQRQNFGL